MEEIVVSMTVTELTLNSEKGCTANIIVSNQSFLHLNKYDALKIMYLVN